MKRLVVLSMALALLAPAAAFAGPITLSPKPVHFKPAVVHGSTSFANMVVTNTGSRPLVVLRGEAVLNVPGRIYQDDNCRTIRILQPGESCKNSLEFQATVPVQIRQSKYCILTEGHRAVCVRLTGRAVAR